MGEQTPASGVGAAGAEVQVRQTGLQPFRLSRLPNSLRPVATLSILVAAGWCSALLMSAVGWGVQYDPQGALFGLMSSGAMGPALVRLTTVGALGIAAAAAIAAAAEPEWDGRRASRIGRRVVAIAVAVIGINLVSSIAVHEGTLGGGTPGERLRLVWSSGLGWTAMVAVVIGLVMPWSTGLARRIAVPLAVVPAGAWLLVALGAGGLTNPWIANVDWRSDPVLHVINGLELLLVLFLAWELVAWTELVAAASTWITRHVPSHGGIVVALVGIKLAWLGTGLAGVLPGLLGGNAGAWRASTGDGPASWVLAAVLAGAAVLAVSRSRGPTDESELSWKPLLLILAVLFAPGIVAGIVDVARWPVTDFVPTGLVDLGQAIAVVVAAGFAVVVIALADEPEAPARPVQLLLVANVCLVAGYLAALLSSIADRPAILRLQEHLPFPEAPSSWYEVPGSITAHYFLAPGVAFLTATFLAVRARRRRHGSPTTGDRSQMAPAVFASALAGVAILYVLPHLPDVPLHYNAADAGASGDLLVPRYSHNLYHLRPATWIGGWNGPAGTFEPATFDTMLTLGLCGLVWRRWRCDAQDWATVTFVLIGSTALAHSSTITPGGWLGNHWYYAAFVVPVAWQFLLRGDELNRLVERRPALAVLNLAVVTLLLTVIGYRLLTGDLNPTIDFEERVLPYGRGITMSVALVPLGALALGRRLRARPT